MQDVAIPSDSVIHMRSPSKFILNAMELPSISRTHTFKTWEHAHQSAYPKSPDDILPLCKSSIPAPHRHKLFGIRSYPAPGSFCWRHLVVLRSDRRWPIGIGICWGRMVRACLPTVFDFVHNKANGRCSEQNEHHNHPLNIEQTHLIQYLFIRNNLRVILYQKGLSSIHNILIRRIPLLAPRISHHHIHNTPHTPKIALGVPKSSRCKDGYFICRRAGCGGYFGTFRCSIGAGGEER